MDRIHGLPKTWKEGCRKRALELKPHGRKQREIAAALGVSAAAVSPWVAETRVRGREAWQAKPRPTGPIKLTPDQRHLVDDHTDHKRWSCTCDLRIHPPPEPAVGYHRSPDMHEGGRDGRPPAVSRPQTARTRGSGHDLLWAVATAPSSTGPRPSPACQVLHEAFARPEVVSGPYHQATLCQL
jgi:hypothetical protein